MSASKPETLYAVNQPDSKWWQKEGIFFCLDCAQDGKTVILASERELADRSCWACHGSLTDYPEVQRQS